MKAIFLHIERRQSELEKMGNCGSFALEKMWEVLIKTPTFKKNQNFRSFSQV